MAKSDKPVNEFVTCPRCGDTVLKAPGGGPAFHFKPGKFVECK